MTRWMPLFLLLLLAACGGGSNEPKELEVDLKEPEGAIAAYQYAITHYDEKVAEKVFALEDREAMMNDFRANVRKHEQDKARFDVEVSDAFQVKDNVVVAQVKWIKLDGEGKQTSSFEQRWVAWIKDTDGLWRVSKTATREYQALVAQQEREKAAANAPANAPGNAPAANSPPANSAPSSNGG